MALRTRENMRPLRSTAVLVAALALCSCSGTKSFWMRNLRPGYRVEPAFYEHAPDTIAVLPITPRFEDLGREEETWAGARAMRYALYRHLSVKDYDDLELDAIDEALEGSGLLAPTAPAPEPGVAESVGSALRSADVLGVWGLVSPWHWAEELGLAEEEVYGERRFEDPAAFGRVHDVLPSADAFVLGQNREFGWFYAVLFSFMRTGGELRLHAADGGDLLWKGGGKETRFEWILASIPEIPIQFVRVWLNTREASFDEATDLLLRRLVRTIPEIDAPTEVVVRAAEELSVFEEPEYSYFFWSDHGEVPEGTLMEFRAEEDGWYEVEAVVEGEPVVGYVFAGEAELVDADDPVVVIRTVLTSGDVFLR